MNKLLVEDLASTASRSDFFLSQYNCFHTHFAKQEEYKEGEDIPIWMDLVDSKKTHLPYNYFDLPVCESIEVTSQQRGKKNKKKFRKNLGQRLQGYNRKASPYEIISKKDMSCTTVCAVQLNAKQTKWLRFLIERQYRVYMSLDGLPVLMRSGDYGVRGFPGQKTVHMASVIFMAFLTLSYRHYSSHSILHFF